MTSCCHWWHRVFTAQFCLLVQKVRVRVIKLTDVTCKEPL